VLATGRQKRCQTAAVFSSKGACSFSVASLRFGRETARPRPCGRASDRDDRDDHAQHHRRSGRRRGRSRPVKVTGSASVRGVRMIGPSIGPPQAPDCRPATRAGGHQPARNWNPMDAFQGSEYRRRTARRKAAPDRRSGHAGGPGGRAHLGVKQPDAEASRPPSGLSLHRAPH